MPISKPQNSIKKLHISAIIIGLIGLFTTAPAASGHYTPVPVLINESEGYVLGDVFSARYDRYSETTISCEYVYSAAKGAIERATKPAAKPADSPVRGRCYAVDSYGNSASCETTDPTLTLPIRGISETSLIEFEYIDAADGAAETPPRCTLIRVRNSSAYIMERRVTK